MISLQGMVPNIPQSLPLLIATELHGFVVQNTIWSDFLLNYLCQQQPVLLIAQHHFIDRTLLRSPELAARLQQGSLSIAEWKHRNKIHLSKAIKSIAQASIHHNVVMLQVDCHKTNVIEDKLCTLEFIQLLKAWAYAEKKLVLFSIYSDLNNPDIQPMLLRSASMFSSLHFINQSYPGWLWTVQYWFTGYHVERWSTHLLEQQTDERHIQFLCADEQQLDTMETLHLMGDKATRFYNHDAVAADESLPAEWNLIEDSVRLETLALKGSDSVFLLGLSLRDNLLLLAEAIFDLRRYQGKHARIIVRVRDTFLRFEDEKLLVLSGANLVLSADVSVRKVINFSELTLGFSYDITQPERFAMLKLQHSIDDIRGYLAPKSFLKHVMQLDIKAESRSIKTVLIKAKVGSGITPSMLIKRFGSRRNGDIISFIGDHLYIYLYSIRIDDLEQVLFMRFGLPAQNIFKDELRIVEHSQVLDICEGLFEQENLTPTAELVFEQEASVVPTENKIVNEMPQAIRKATFL